MYYTIDKIDEFIVTLENRDTKEITYINKTNLPSNIKEGSILKYENNTYQIDKSLEQELRNNILEKFNRLKGND